MPNTYTMASIIGRRDVTNVEVLVAKLVSLTVDNHKYIDAEKQFGNMNRLSVAQYGETFA